MDGLPRIKTAPYHNHTVAIQYITTTPKEHPSRPSNRCPHAPVRFCATYYLSYHTHAYAKSCLGKPAFLQLAATGVFLNYPGTCTCGCKRRPCSTCRGQKIPAPFSPHQPSLFLSLGAYRKRKTTKKREAAYTHQKPIPVSYPWRMMSLLRRTPVNHLAGRSASSRGSSQSRL